MSMLALQFVLFPSLMKIPDCWMAYWGCLKNFFFTSLNIYWCPHQFSSALYYFHMNNTVRNTLSTWNKQIISSHTAALQRQLIYYTMTFSRTTALHQTPIKTLSRASCHRSDELSATATGPFQTICCHTSVFLRWCKMLVLYEVAR